MLGQVPDVDDVLAAADAIVLLTRDGGLPEALVLAAAAGVPFVSYDIDGARELRRSARTGSSWRPATSRLRPAPWSTCWSRTGPAIDATPWSRDAVLAGYRSVMVDALTP